MGDWPERRVEIALENFEQALIAAALREWATATEGRPCFPREAGEVIAWIRLCRRVADDLAPPSAEETTESDEGLPLRAVATIDTLARLVRWLRSTDERLYPEVVAVISDDEDALAALNACLGVGEGGPVPWDCDHVVSRTIREVDA